MVELWSFIFLVVLINFTVQNLLNYCVMLWSGKALLHFTPKRGYISAVFMKFASQFKYKKDSGAKNTIKSYYLIGLKRLSTNISFSQKKKGIISCSKYGVKLFLPLLLHLQKECDCLKH